MKLWKMEWKRVVYLVKYSHPLHFFNSFMAVVTSVCSTLLLIIQARVSVSEPVLRRDYSVVQFVTVCSHLMLVSVFTAKQMMNYCLDTSSQPIAGLDRLASFFLAVVFQIIK